MSARSDQLAGVEMLLIVVDFMGSVIYRCDEILPVGVWQRKLCKTVVIASEMRIV